MKTVALGMSGGVDSSVSALLLKEQGYRVIGLFMKNWDETECNAAQEYEDVVRVCEQLKIPHYAIRFVEEYKEAVFNEFLTGLKAGLTPNPDILCNRHIKFDAFLKKALELGADAVATGHYARLDQGQLMKGIDPQKDQSYFLYAVEKAAFEKVLFPVGNLKKSEVRALAEKHQLATAKKKDSTGICFIGERKFKPFMQTYVGFQPGPIETLSGKLLGEHEGLSFHTMGQRKGLGLGGEGEPWYVVGKDIARNTLLVERGKDHPSLFSSTLSANQLNWHTDTLPSTCSAKIRYRQEDQPCTLELHGPSVTVTFETPQRAITPGQSIVFYDGSYCLGGGTIFEKASLEIFEGNLNTADPLNCNRSSCV